MSDRSNPVSFFQWIGVVPTIIGILGTVAAAGYFAQSMVSLQSNQSELKTTVVSGFRETNDTLRTIPLQTRQIADLERQTTEIRKALDDARRDGSANRDRLAASLTAKDESLDRAINELRQAAAIDHADLVRLREQMSDFINGRATGRSR